MASRLDENNRSIAILQSTDGKNLEIQNHVQELRNDYYILIHAVDDVEKGLKALQIQINPQPSFVCRLCGGITFTNEESYWAHMRNQHRS